MRCDVLLKCVGFETNEGNERLLGASRVHAGPDVLKEGVWVVTEVAAALLPCCPAALLPCCPVWVVTEVAAAA